MDKKKIEKITAILNLTVAAARYGIPAIRKILTELEDKNEPTLEEIEALAGMLKRPEEYFELDK
jgi:hypothetical protein